MSTKTDDAAPGGVAPGGVSPGGEAWAGLAPVYDQLFPPGKPQLEFIAKVVSGMLHPARRLLDVGCATGGYALALAEAGFAVTGVDLSPEMIRLAQARAQAWEREHNRAAPGGKRKPTPRFVVADMTDLQGLPFDEQAPFEAVICLGNTLAQLLSAAELGAALGEMARVLVEGGRAILQTVNYDRLGATGEIKFPPITLPGPRELVFHRSYGPRSDGLITFVTTLVDAGGGVAAPGGEEAGAAPEGPAAQIVFRAETVLRPTARDEVEAVARLAFHGEVEVYGDFLFSPWSVASRATVVVAGRGPD